MEISNTAKNSVTNDLLISKASNESYRKGYDRIFGKKTISGKLPKEQQPKNKQGK